ncbi:hypothetical protein A9D14_19175 (plasmid) [Croceicoccus marinus]|uniref:Uncharacterized protein n=1 Tax=Croceicoccus marinus TaxID=450378 RepID=A0A217EZ73_9SPHN|nr:hypothetical protein A9D14_19175 [Croceicoccus marinus]
MASADHEFPPDVAIYIKVRCTLSLSHGKSKDYPTIALKRFKPTEKLIVGMVAPQPPVRTRLQKRPVARNLPSQVQKS